MKKLMVMAVVMGLGFAAQAQTINVDWQCNSSTYLNYAAYVMTQGSSVASLLSDGDVDSALSILGTQNLSSSSASSGAASGSFSVDSSNIQWNDTSSQVYYDLFLITDDQSEWQKATIDVLYSRSKFIKGYNYNDVSASPLTIYDNNWQTIPEPTSGLLMLLGMAGLALKRKRA